MQHASHVVRSLESVATSLRILNVASGCIDLTDHFEKGYSAAELRRPDERRYEGQAETRL